MCAVDCPVVLPSPLDLSVPMGAEGLVLLSRYPTEALLRHCRAVRMVGLLAPSAMSEQTKTDKWLAEALSYIRRNIDESATESSTPESLSLDSLDLVEIVMEVEQECDCVIDDDWLEDAKPTNTLRQIAELVSGRAI